MDAAVRQCNGRKALSPDSDYPTIFARSTGALPSAIAIVRISGPQAGETLLRLTSRRLPPPRAAVLRRLTHPGTGDPLDTAMVLWFPGPGTATGEDLAELHLHGGRAVVAVVEAALSDIPGLRAAAPGDFTRRAFENGRLDLTQVEGLGDLLSAQTERQRMAALVVAEGGLRREVERWQSELLGLAARAEAAIDFADEDDVKPADDTLRIDIRQMADRLNAVLDSPPGERLRDGVRIAIAGPPNAGKSTLLNALVGRDAAIASPIAGTTRDLIEAPINLQGLPVIFTDMAGLRTDAADGLEAIGIDRAQAAIAQSDIVIWLGQPDVAPVGEHVLVVGNKCDLARPDYDCVEISAKTGEGISGLVAALINHIEAVLPIAGEVALNANQRDNLAAMVGALKRATMLCDEVLVADEIRVALRAIDRITGAADTETMLDHLFGRFCIGK